MATSLTYSTVAKFGGGNFRARLVDVTADGTYSTGGYALATADLQALAGGTNSRVIADLVSFDSETNLGGVQVSLDRTNTKLLFFEAGAQATTTISSKTVRCTVYHSLSNFK